MLCRFVVALGAGCGNRTHFVSLKKASAYPYLPIPRNLVGDAGIEPAWSRLRGECISHLCQSPLLQQNGAGCWNRTNASRLSTAGSTFELILHGAPFGS